MFHHESVLLKESIEGLNINPNGIYVDCTLGGGGHSSEILKRLDKGFLYCFDQDEEAIIAANTRLKRISRRYEIIQRNFKDLKEELNHRNVCKVNGILFDLGVSSPQFDQGKRGFSYQKEAKLDMRMDVNQSLSAYDIVNHYAFQDLFRIISRYGEERYAKNIARGIEKAREKKAIETTFELVDIIKKSVPAKSLRGKHPAKRTFQALRIETNRELEVLPEALEKAIDLLDVDGRICVISFHSLEDRIVKDIFKKYSKTPDVPRGLPILPKDLERPILKRINRKVIIPSNEELEENNRAHSAKLRIVQKVKEK